MTEHQNEVPSPRQSSESIVTILLTIVSPALAVLGILYSVASGDYKPGPLIVTLIAAAFLVVAVWQYVKSRHLKWTVIAPAVMVVAVPLSSATLPSLWPTASVSPTVNVGPDGASIVTTRLLPTKTPGPQYVVDVMVIDQPPKDRMLWLVSVLYAEPGKVKDTLYFVKARVPSTPGTYQVPIRYCKPLARDLKRALTVVIADTATSRILAKNRHEEDNCIENTDMTNLAGATPVSDAFELVASP